MIKKTDTLRHKLISRVVDVRSDELGRTGAMFALLGLIIATSYIVKPVRNSLFLSQFGAERLPYVYIVVAIIAGFVAAGFTRIVSRYRINSVYIGASLFFASNLVLFWWAVESGWSYTGFVFYVWVSIYTITMPSLFWLSANYFFYPNEARRIFSVLGAGGLLGSIAGGSLTSILVVYIGTSGLLLAASGVLVLIAALTVWTERRERNRISELQYDLRKQEMRRLAKKDEGAFSLIARSRYLTLIAILTVFTIMTSTLVDYQFNAVAEKAFPDLDALTRFFGTFFASISVLAFVLQLFLAGRILSRFGIGAGLRILPTALLAGAAGFLAVPGLWAAAALKAADDGLSNSVNRSSVEILWLPISVEVKNRVKAWLDMFVDRVSRGIGGLLILSAITFFSLSPDHISQIVLVLAAGWLVLTFLLKREYVKAFRLSLSRRDIDIEALTADVQDQQSVLVLQQLLSGTDEKQTLYALELLAGTDDQVLAESVSRLTAHSSSTVRAAALRLLADFSSPPPLEDLDALTRDENPEVGAEALRLLLKTDFSRGVSELEKILQSGDTERIHIVLNHMENGSELIGGILNLEFVQRYDASEKEEERAIAAQALGFLPETPETLEILSRLLRDPATAVARAASTSAVHIKNEALVPILLDQLHRRSLRVTARRALVGLGAQVAADATEMLMDPSRDPEIRRALPRLLAEFDDQKIVNQMLAYLPQSDPAIHFQIIRALNKMRANMTRLRFPGTDVDRLLEFESRNYCILAGQKVSIDGSGRRDGCQALLGRALEERLETANERIFRLLGLRYPPTDIFNAWNRINHGRPAVRAAALEFLGNTLSTGHKETVLPLLESGSWVEVHELGKSVFGITGRSLHQVLINLLEGDDAWLSACAATMVGAQGITPAREAVERLGSHPDPIAREAAVSALERL
jgi:ATP/ADP translocase/HEAT repeat protein